jgi:hypothetical protein
MMSARLVVAGILKNWPHLDGEVIMSEPKSNNSLSSTPDQLVNSGSSAIIKLSEPELDGVTGGVRSLTVRVPTVRVPTVRVP